MEGSSRIGMFAAVAIVSAAIGAFAYRSLAPADSDVCDVHPHLTASQRATIHNNLDRVRAQTFDAAGTDKHDRDAANRDAEDAAFDTFAHSLRDPLQAEYLRHRQALDGCF